MEEDRAGTGRYGGSAAQRGAAAESRSKMWRAPTGITFGIIYQTN